MWFLIKNFGCWNKKPRQYLKYFSICWLWLALWWASAHPIPSSSLCMPAGLLNACPEPAWPECGAGQKCEKSCPLGSALYKWLMDIGVWTPSFLTSAVQLYAHSFPGVTGLMAHLFVDFWPFSVSLPPLPRFPGTTFEINYVLLNPFLRVFWCN